MAQRYNELSRGEALEIYIAYDSLKAKDLAKYLRNFSDIAEKIAEDYFARFDTYQGEQMPSLDIETMQTGSSIKFKLKEGWKPKISSNAEADIVVEVPKLLGIPFVVGYLLLQSANAYQDYRLKELEIEEKELDIEIKKQELSKAIADDNNAEQPASQTIIFYMDTKVPEIKPILQDTIKSVLSNPDITSFKVNGIEIKPMEKQ